jgi:hypothetical protein
LNKKARSPKNPPLLCSRKDKTPRYTAAERRERQLSTAQSTRNKVKTE